MHSTKDVFRIFCTNCCAERMATKHARQRIDDFGGLQKLKRRPPKWIGINRCMCCGALYESFLPTDHHGKRGSGVPGVPA